MASSIPRTPVSKVPLSKGRHRPTPSKSLIKRDYMGAQNYKKFLTYKNGMSFVAVILELTSRSSLSAKCLANTVPCRGKWVKLNMDNAVNYLLIRD